MADFDANIAKALEDDETFQGILAQLKEAASSEVTITHRDPCPNERCNCKHFRTVKVPDYKTKLAIMEFLANRGVGRPAQSEGDGDKEKIVFIREVRK